MTQEELEKYEAEKDEMAMVSMEIILHAGDARTFALEAVDDAMMGNYEEAEKKLAEAEKEINLAHNAQTSVVQAEAGGKVYNYYILFCHAQDTVMTITSEVNLAKKLVALCRHVDKKVSEAQR